MTEPDDPDPDDYDYQQWLACAAWSDETEEPLSCSDNVVTES